MRSYWITITGEKPPGEKLRWISLGFRPGAFHRGANVRGAFHLEPVNHMSEITLLRAEVTLLKIENLTNRFIEIEEEL